MPQVQVIDTTETPPEPTELQKFFSKMGKSYEDRKDRMEIGNLLEEYRQNRGNANAWEDLQINLEKSTISPSRRLQVQNSLNEQKKLIVAQDKALNSKVSKGILNQEDRARQKGTLLKAGWPEYAAEMYLDAPPGVKQTLEREHAALVERGYRSPLAENTQGSTPQESPVADPTQPGAATPTQNQLEIEKTEEWPAPIVPKNMNNAERIKWENNNEKENNKELKSTNEKKKAFRNNDILINSMTQVNDGKYLPEGIEKMLIIDPDSGDIRPTAQLLKVQNPQTELYVKNLKQWLKGAKEYFGARVTNFDVSSFMQQLPGLLNSEQGRRLILKQMKYVNDLESVHNTALNEGLKKYGRNANYSQISDIVDKKVEAREGELLGKINNLVLASKDIELMSKNPEKFKNHVLMQNPDGAFKAVPKDKVEYLKTKQWRDF